MRDRERREKERQQLADLVGKNLTAVSQLDGLTFELYCDTVLPRVMEQIISCKDDIAQQYLMQALIQVRRRRLMDCISVQRALWFRNIYVFKKSQVYNLCFNKTALL